MARQRPEGVIAVVAHSGFLRCTSHQYALDAAGIVKDELHRWCVVSISYPLHMMGLQAALNELMKVEFSQHGP